MNNDNNNDKENIEQEKVNNLQVDGLYEKIRKKMTLKEKIFCWILIFMVPYLFDILPPNFIFDNPKATFQIANFHYTYKALLLLDKMHLQDSGLTIAIRNSLMNQYINIHNSFKDDVYNPLGVFYSIDYEFNKYSKGNKNSEQYNYYKKQYLEELHKVLMEYPLRTHSYKQFLDIRGQAWFHYVISNRITIYPELAINYLHYKSPIKIDEETLNDLTKILNSFDLIFEQEQSLNTRQYQCRLYTPYFKRFNYFYPKFLYYYSSKIIALESLLHPETFCDNTDTFSKYKQSIEQGQTDDTGLSLLLKTKCNYEV